MRPLPHLVLVAALGLLGAGCASVPDATTPPVEAPPLAYADSTVEEDKLLNVWIERFDHAPIESEEVEEAGVGEEIREAEELFIPVHLKDTLQATGYFGAVRVVPNGESMVGGELTVSGTIDRSNGREMEIDVVARDALGQVWLDRSYSSKVVPANYDRLAPSEWDAFQVVYNEIANDLIEVLRQQSPEQARRIREAAKLRFASYIAPTPYEEYFSVGEDGEVEIERLPAENDPTYERVLALKGRNDMLADVLNEHYNQFYDGMWDSYTNWRQSSLNEILALERIEQEAAAKKIGGIAAILGGIALNAAGGQTSSRTGALQTVMIAGGALALKAGFDQSSEGEIHESAIRELGNSFESEIEPMVVELEGETVELTGSAEAQFKQWRDLLQARFEAERGLDSEAPESEDGESGDVMTEASAG